MHRQLCHLLQRQRQHLPTVLWEAARVTHPPQHCSSRRVPFTQIKRLGCCCVHPSSTTSHCPPSAHLFCGCAMTRFVDGEPIKPEAFLLLIHGRVTFTKKAQCQSGAGTVFNHLSRRRPPSFSPLLAKKIH